MKYDARLHGPRVPGRQPPLTVHFLKKFLTIVKRRCRCCPNKLSIVRLLPLGWPCIYRGGALLLQ